MDDLLLLYLQLRHGAVVHHVRHPMVYPRAPDHALSQRCICPL